MAITSKIFRLEVKQVKLTDLYAEVSSVYVVSEEEVLGGGRGTADLEQLHQVVELAVDVSAD